MNKGAIAVIALAIGAIILLLLGKIYQGGIHAAAIKVFSKVESDVDNLSFNDILPSLKVNVASLF